MWYSDKIYENLRRLNDCDEVGEIILIDNNSSLKPTDLPSYPKVKHLTQEENIYVNPAWNLGVRLSVYKYICICNDDIIFDTDVFQFIQPHLNEGIYGMSTANYYSEGKDEPYGIRKIEKRPWGWGCLFFLHKDNYLPIDERLKIACGDDWLLHYTKGGAYEIKNLDLQDDKVSVTTIRGEFFGIQKQDIELWSQYSR